MVLEILKYLQCFCPRRLQWDESPWHLGTDRIPFRNIYHFFVHRTLYNVELIGIISAESTEIVWKIARNHYTDVDLL